MFSTKYFNTEQQLKANKISLFEAIKQHEADINSSMFFTDRDKNNLRKGFIKSVTGEADLNEYNKLLKGN